MAFHAGVSKKGMRKGTHSCIACRRRKIKCVFPEPSATICNGCISNALECIPQGSAARLEDYQSVDPKTTYTRTSSADRYEDDLLGILHLLRHGEQRGATQRVQSILRDLSSSKEGVSGSTRPASPPAAPEQPIESATAPLMRILHHSMLDRGQTGSTDQPIQHHSPLLLDSPAYQTMKADHRNLEAVRDLLSYMPSEHEAENVYRHQSSWWPFWRDTLGLVWGDKKAESLKEFASQALEERTPCLLGLLLVCYAISTNDPSRFMPAVERRILMNDELASTEHGICCLLAGSMVYLNVLRPRRAWLMNRRAVSLLQLNGLHRRQRRLEKHDTLLWGVFHADRWISLIVGMPYCMVDHFCDLSIPSMSKLGPSMWLYRQLSVLSGRVIDALQSSKRSDMAAALDIEEQLEALRSQLPKDYLEINAIRGLSDKTEKHTRLYRLIHWLQLRLYVFLPLLLLSQSDDRYDFSRKTAVKDARGELEAYLLLYESDASTLFNGSVINFHAFIAAVVVLLGLMGYGCQQHPSPHIEDESDWRTITQVLHALKRIEAGMAGILSRRCRIALESLVLVAQKVNAEDYSADEPSAETVVLPYFGTVRISRSAPVAQKSKEQSATTCPTEETAWQGRSLPASTHVINGAAIDPVSTWEPLRVGPYPSFDIAYCGPYMAPGTEMIPQWPGAAGNETMMPLAEDVSSIPYDMNDMTLREPLGGHDWSWLDADLPPSMTLY